MKTSFLLFTMVLFATIFVSCRTEHEINTIHEVKPIHITIDINIKVDKALDDVFADLDDE